MEDIFRENKWALVYIDDILICSNNLQEHLKHLQELEIGKKDIELFGFKISTGQVILQEHVLKVFAHFPD